MSPTGLPLSLSDSLCTGTKEGGSDFLLSLYGYLEIWSWGEGSHFCKETVESHRMTRAPSLSTAPAFNSEAFNMPPPHTHAQDKLILVPILSQMFPPLHPSSAFQLESKLYP